MKTRWAVSPVAIVVVILLLSGPQSSAAIEAAERNLTPQCADALSSLESDVMQGMISSAADGLRAVVNILSGPCQSEAEAAPQEVPRTATTLSPGCEGSGTGTVHADIVILNVHYPIQDEFAVGDFKRALYSTVVGDGATLGVKSVAKEATTIRVATVPGIPTLGGGAVTTCGEKTATIEASFLGITYAVDIKTIIACNGRANGGIGVTGVLYFAEYLSLTNPVGCDAELPHHTVEPAVLQACLPTKPDCKS